MAEMLKFQNANELREIEALQEQLTEARRQIMELTGALLEEQSVNGVWHHAALEAEEEVQALLDDVAHGHQRAMFLQRENTQLRDKLDTLQEKYNLAMTWRNEGAD